MNNHNHGYKNREGNSVFDCSIFFFYFNNRWMLSFSSILNEIVRVQLRPYTAVKLMIKSFDIQAFADPRHHQG